MDDLKLTLKSWKRRWDSSDPERAPPPLPMNPSSRSTSPTTKANVSPGIQAAAANFTDKARENASSPYTTNPMPQKSSSPEKSLIKGHYHKRMQSLQNTDTRGEFLNYLDGKSLEKSPERLERPSTLDPAAKEPALNTSKSSDALTPTGNHTRNASDYYVSNRYLSRPILSENTPPSATMLALQNMQLPAEPESPSPTKDVKPHADRQPPKHHNFESISSQIHGLTTIASELQREMAKLSRRSKDNATDLVSLKAATNSRDEDIRKSLRDLSSNLVTKAIEHETGPR